MTACKVQIVACLPFCCILNLPSKWKESLPTGSTEVCGAWMLKSVSVSQGTATGGRAVAYQDDHENETSGDRLGGGRIV